MNPTPLGLGLLPPWTNPSSVEAGSLEGATDARPPSQMRIGKAPDRPHNQPMPQWLTATLWGLLAGAALLVGAAISYFADVPRRSIAFVMAFGSGVLISALAFAYAMLFLVKTLLFGTDVPGFPTLVISVMFFSGVQLISLGVIGEYLGRVYEEVKGRPLYLVAEELGVGRDASRMNLGPVTEHGRTQQH